MTSDQVTPAGSPKKHVLNGPQEVVSAAVNNGHTWETWMQKVTKLSLQSKIIELNADASFSLNKAFVHLNTSAYVYIVIYLKWEPA